MTLYKYKAKDKEGKIYERTLEAPSKVEVYGEIRTENGTPILIKEVGRFKNIFSFKDLFGGIKTQQKINFAKNLGAMINAGLSVTRALSVMSRQSNKKSFKKLLTDLESDVSHGKTLSESLAKWPKVFSTLFVSMVRAGEESGNVSGSLAIVASQMEKAYLLAKKVRGALIYPAVIISVMIVLAILLLFFMVPTLTATFEGLGVKLPLSTRILIYLSNFLVEHTLLVLSGMTLIIASVVLFLRSKVGRNLTDIVILHLPVIGEMVKEFGSARTARTIASLLSSGVEILVALDVRS